MCHVLGCARASLSLFLSLTCSLFRFNVFFSRSQSPCLSPTTFVTILSPSPTSARLPLRFCSAHCFVLPARPLARSSPLAPTLSRIYVRYSGCYKLCHFIDEKHGEKACSLGRGTSVNGELDYEDVFTGYVNDPDNVSLESVNFHVNTYETTKSTKLFAHAIHATLNRYSSRASKRCYLFIYQRARGSDARVVIMADRA